MINYGIDDDVTLAASLLHDVLEDCGDKLPLEGAELEVKYRISGEVVDIIRVLTKESGLDDHELSVYFKRIAENPKAALIKLSDRLHNSSTLYNLSYEKLKKIFKGNRYVPDSPWHRTASGIIRSIRMPLIF